MTLQLFRLFVCESNIGKIVFICIVFVLTPHTYSNMGQVEYIPYCYFRTCDTDLQHTRINSETVRIRTNKHLRFVCQFF